MTGSRKNKLIRHLYSQLRGIGVKATVHSVYNRIEAFVKPFIKKSGFNPDLVGIEVREEIKDNGGTRYYAAYANVKYAGCCIFSENMISLDILEEVIMSALIIYASDGTLKYMLRDITVLVNTQSPRP